MSKNKRQVMDFLKEMEDTEDKYSIISMLREDYGYDDNDNVNGTKLEDMSLEELNKLLDDIESEVEDFMYPNGHDVQLPTVKTVGLTTLNCSQSLTE